MRFAEHGHPAVAIDYFGAHSGGRRRGTPTSRTRSTCRSRRRDAGAARHRRRRRVPALAERRGLCRASRPSASASEAVTAGSPRAVGTGSWPPSASTATRASGTASRARPTLAGTFEAPILALMGGADAATSPPTSWPEFDAALEGAGVPHEIVTYPGAPHSFFDRRYEEFADASADAWQRTLAFIDRSILRARAPSMRIIVAVQPAITITDDNGVSVVELQGEHDLATAAEVRDVLESAGDRAAADRRRADAHRLHRLEHPRRAARRPQTCPRREPRVRLRRAGGRLRCGQQDARGERPARVLPGARVARRGDRRRTSGPTARRISAGAAGTASEASRL